MSKETVVSSAHIIESFFDKPNAEEEEPLPAMAARLEDKETEVVQHEEDEQYLMMLPETASIVNNTAISSMLGAAASSLQHSQLDNAVYAFEKAAKVAHEDACHYITQEAARVNQQLWQLKVEQDAENEHDQNLPQKKKRRLSSTSCSSSLLYPEKPASAALVLREPEDKAMRDEALLQQAIRSKRMIDLLFKLQRVQMRLLDEMMACADDADFVLDEPIHEDESAAEYFS
ncbi:hypothetical protein ACA910_007567 [Epithemia clementina (nom. ined.)]